MFDPTIVRFCQENQPDVEAFTHFSKASYIKLRDNRRNTVALACYFNFTFLVNLKTQIHLVR